MPPRGHIGATADPHHRATIIAAPGAIQGIYYGVSGTWPLIAYRSFEAITGRKREPWLVKMVGLLTVLVGGVLVTDPTGRTRQARRLGVGSALAYAAVDVWYAGVRRRISPVYLLDAFFELALVAAWARTDLSAQATPRRAEGARRQ